MVSATQVKIGEHEFVMWREKDNFKGKLFTLIPLAGGKTYKPSWVKKDLPTLTNTILSFGLSKGIWSQENLKNNMTVNRNYNYNPQTRTRTLNIDPSIVASILDGIEEIKENELEPTNGVIEQEFLSDDFINAEIVENEIDDEMPMPEPTKPESKKSKKK